MHLLEDTPKTANVIAVDCGFNCYSRFFKLFKKKTGLSPDEWRKKIDKKPSLLHEVYTDGLNQHFGI